MEIATGEMFKLSARKISPAQGLYYFCAIKAADHTASLLA
jgi:hypothetical protein